MLMVISPAKTLDYESPLATSTYTQPEFLEDACELVDQLKELEPHQVSNLMSISDKLGQLNAERFDSVDVAVTTMSEVGEAMANGGANAYEERSRALEKRGVAISKGKRGGAFKSQGHTTDAGIARAAAPTEPSPATPPRKVRKVDFDLFMPMTVDILAGMTEAFMDC